jgi:hypothetical protein
MNIDVAKSIVGSRPDWELRNMYKALGFFAWCNTAEENQRREACRVVLRDRAKQRAINRKKVKK